MFPVVKCCVSFAVQTELQKTAVPPVPLRTATVATSATMATVASERPWRLGRDRREVIVALRLCLVTLRYVTSGVRLGKER
jgi:hypothetical protein